MRCIWLALTCGGCALGTGDKMPWPYAAAPAAGDRHESMREAAPAELATTTAVARGGPSEDQLGDDLRPALAPPVDVIGAPLALTFGWPLAATGINSLFGERLDPLDGKRRFHGGVDLDGPYGAIVVASAPGRVSHAGWAQGHGRQVIVEHAGGFRTVYSHLSQVLVLGGAHVRAGDPVGQVGNSGRSTGPHLHFEISRWERHLDPLDLLGQTLSVR